MSHCEIEDLQRYARSCTPKTRPNQAAGAERLVIARTIETRAEANEIAAPIPGRGVLWW